MQSPQKVRTQRRIIRTPIRILSPPLSPPPTSPLPPPPWNSGKKEDDIETKTAHELRSQTSLPNLKYQRPYAKNSQLRVDHEEPIVCYPHLPSGLGSSTWKASSDSDLPSLNKSARQKNEKCLTDTFANSSKGHRAVQLHSQSQLDIDKDLESDTTSLSLALKQPEQARVSESESKPNRSKRPPRKAVARSALYIPHAARSQQNVAFVSNDLNTTPIQENDIITSLPRYPSGDDLSRFMEACQSDVPDKDRWHRSIISCTSPEKAAGIPDGQSDSPVPRKLSKKRSHQSTWNKQTVPSTVTSTECPDQSSDLDRVLLPQDAEAKTEITTPLVQAENSAPGEGEDDDDLESGAHRQTWYARHKRLLWIILTVIFVILATAAVLGGVLTKVASD